MLLTAETRHRKKVLPVLIIYFGFTVGERRIRSDNNLTVTKWVKYSFAHVNARTIEQYFVKTRVH